MSFSAFARGQNNPETLRSGVTRAAGVVALVVVPSTVGLAVLAEDAVAVVYGPQWEARDPSHPGARSGGGGAGDLAASPHR